MAERVCRYRRVVGATTAVAALFVVLIAVTPHSNVSAAGISRSGSADRHQTLHQESTAPAVRGTTATQRDPLRVGAFVLLGGITPLVLMARAASHRRSVKRTVGLTPANHGRAPPPLLPSN